MVRIKRGNVARKRRKKILQLAKGYRGAHSRLFRVANQQVMKALRYSYTGRKQKKHRCIDVIISLSGFWIRKCLLLRRVLSMHPRFRYDIGKTLHHSSMNRHRLALWTKLG